MFPKFYYKLLCFDKNIIGQIGVQGLNKYLNLPYKIGLIWGGVGFSISLKFYLYGSINHLWAAKYSEFMFIGTISKALLFISVLSLVFAVWLCKGSLIFVVIGSQILYAISNI